MDSFIIALWVLNFVFACVFLHSAYSVYSNWNNGDVSIKGYIALMVGTILFGSCSTLFM